MSNSIIFIIGVCVLAICIAAVFSFKKRKEEDEQLKNLSLEEQLKIKSLRNIERAIWISR